jgi:hypothetical protein
MMTALLSKEMAADDAQINIFKAFVGHNYPIFMESYN